MLTSVRRAFFENSPVNYPYGNTRSRNVFQDFSCDIGGSYLNSTMKVLFLGCGDLRNALQVATNESFNRWEIHMNDINPTVVARNITILKIISASDFNPENNEDFAFVWDIWYNLEWPEITRKRFQQTMKDLLNDLLPQEISIPKTIQYEMLKEVWSSWLLISSEADFKASLFMKKIDDERKLFVCQGWDNMHPGELAEEAKGKNTDLFSIAIEEIASHVERKIGIEGLSESVRQYICDEASRFFKRGSCRLERDVAVVCVNPTMLDPVTLHWENHHSLNPFGGYLPLKKEELDTSVKNKMMIRSCQKILKNLLSSYRQRLIKDKTMNVYFYLEDALELCYSENVNKFEVIDCSNVADQIGLLNLILACHGKLSDHPEAVLFTETLNWLNLSYSVKSYVEKALCCPLSMIPTMYGLRLTSRVELGSHEIYNMRRPMAQPVALSWQKAPPFRNIVLLPSPALDGCFDQLANVCFDAKFPYRFVGVVPPGSRCGMVLYTPQTFNYAVNSMIQRIGGDHCLKNVKKMEMLPFFRLARQTMDAWKNGQKILKLSAVIPAVTAVSLKKMDSLKGTPTLRLILMPKASYNRYDLFGPDVHYIDNFQLVMKKTLTGFENISVSFLLIPDHGLEKTHLAFVIDIVNGSTIFLFESFKSMLVEEWNIPYPFVSTSSHLELPHSEEMHMKVDSCFESEEQYHLKINISVENVSGLKVSTNHKAPCESCHEINLSLTQPTNIKPLSLTFPYPILVDDIRAVLHRRDHYVELVLKKSLWEPWPCEYRSTDSCVLDPAKLKPWKEEQSSFSNPNYNSLNIHLRVQFNFKQLENPSLIEKSPLNFARDVISALFVNTSRCVRIQWINATTPDWFLRVHRPVVTTPVGSPALLISAYDFRLAEKLTASGKWNEKKYVENFSRVFPKYGEIEKRLTIEIETAEQSQLLRFILRLNSTKIKPSIWQEKNVTLGDDSPWMATFISPLYIDCPFNQIETNNTFPSTKLTASEIAANDNSRCHACKKVPQNLKRCSRCRATVYCSVECQRHHWAEHKKLCKKI